MLMTAPFASNVHMAPYHYCSGFSKYWYEYLLALHGFRVKNADRQWRLVRPAAARNHRPRRSGPPARQLGLAFRLRAVGADLFQTAQQHAGGGFSLFCLQCVAVKKMKPKVVALLSDKVEEFYE